MTSWLLSEIAGSARFAEAPALRIAVRRREVKGDMQSILAGTLLLLAQFRNWWGVFAPGTRPIRSVRLDRTERRYLKRKIEIWTKSARRKHVGLPSGRPA